MISWFWGWGPASGGWGALGAGWGRRVKSESAPCACAILCGPRVKWRCPPSQLRGPGLPAVRCAFDHVGHGGRFCGAKWGERGRGGRERAGVVRFRCCDQVPGLQAALCPGAPAAAGEIACFQEGDTPPVASRQQLRRAVWVRRPRTSASAAARNIPQYRASNRAPPRAPPLPKPRRSPCAKHIVAMASATRNGFMVWCLAVLAAV